MLALLQLADFMELLSIIKAKNTIRLTQLGSIFIACWFVSSGFVFLVSHKMLLTYEILYIMVFSQLSFVLCVAYSCVWYRIPVGLNTIYGYSLFEDVICKCN